MDACCAERCAYPAFRLASYWAISARALVMASGAGGGVPCIAGGMTGWTSGAVVLASTAAVASEPNISDTRLIGFLILLRLRRA